MMRSISSTFVAASLIVSAGACGGVLPHSREAGAVQPLTVRAVEWNPAHTAVASPRAVADNGDAVVVFGDKGSWTFRSGALSSHTDNATPWKSAAAISGADGSPRWIVGVDGKGALQHLRGAGSFEDVTARYGLPVGQVRGAAMVDAQRVAFLLDGKLAVADGEKVTRYAAASDGETAFSAIAGGGGYVAGVGKDEVALVHVEDGSIRRFALKGARDVAVTSDGSLYAATARGLYGMVTDHTSVNITTLALLYVSAGEDLHGLAASGDRVWFADGGELGSFPSHGGGPISETTGAKIDPRAGLAGSSSGDVWVLGTSDVKRFATNDATPLPSASTANVAWTGSLLPVFARNCAACHQADGVSGVDLSSYAAWQSNRSDIVEQVLTKRAMPPYGRPPVSDADRQAITSWANAGGSVSSAPNK